MSMIAVRGGRARGGGRPRSEPTRRLILAATIDLLERESVQSITIEAIARRAGVSKATIYRWWNSKASVVIDAFMEHHIVHTPMPQDMHPAEAMVRHWRSLAAQYGGWPGRIVSQILAEGQADLSILTEFRERFHHGRRDLVAQVGGRLLGLTPRATAGNIRILSEMLYSAIYMRLLWGHAPLDAEFIRDFPITAFSLIGIALDGEGRVID